MMNIKVGSDGDFPMRIQAPGTYEWWYFDAIDEARELAITIILFDGMPMSPYWLEALPHADSKEYSGYSVTLYRKGKKLAGFVHHTEHNEILVHDDEIHIRMGGLTMHKVGNEYAISLNTHFPDSTHSLIGDIAFKSLMPEQKSSQIGEGNHCWRLIAPQCSVDGNLALAEYDDIYNEWSFNGHGYHDCNSGNDSLDADYDDWYWGRCPINDEQSIIYYHYPASQRNKELSIVFLADEERGMKQIEACSIKLGDVKLTSSLMSIANSIHIDGMMDGIAFKITIKHLQAMEFGPFYYRFLIETRSNGTSNGHHGIAEYFNAKRLKSGIVRTMIKTPMQRV